MLISEPAAVANTPVSIADLLTQQRAFFATGQTQDRQFRLAQLRKLQTAIIAAQDQLTTALNQDLGRPPFEAYFELTALKEIKTAIKNLRRWMKPRRTKTAIEVFPATAWVKPQPLGIALIITPWNYPFKLAIAPLVGAIAAGNCAIIKPSEHAPATSALLAKLLGAIFEPQYVAVVEGNASVCQTLLTEKFDHIFFTGSKVVGKIVMQAAAQHLTPVTLELGGKSPCIVDKSARIEWAAQRIAWGRFINAGQTCIAPDYVVVDRAIKDEFIAGLKKAITTLYGENPALSPDYGRIVNQRQFDRLTQLLDYNKVIVGGETNASDRYFAPTILDNVDWDDPIMAEEIFGPILPVLVYDDIAEVIVEINEKPHPLALYVFSGDRALQQRIMDNTFSGGVVLNDVVMQVNIPDLPFGGVGDSGMGKCHGQASFAAFSHYRSYLRRSMFLDIDLRSAPYDKIRLRLFQWLLTGR
jgi:aldehyde dehydrogenase (NAD+)